ncbi:MAG: nitrate reductase molybdenum cofactor assembly chaperone [Burkholderiales bacterium]
MKTYKVLAALLSYPDEALIEALPELKEALDSERVFSRSARASVDRLVAELESGDIYDIQERYVDLFDRVRSLSLNLFEHLHGETRDRGQAMVDLKQLYERHGFTLAAGELPDYLPALLEYLSLIDAAEARDLLAETAEILKGIGARLDKRGSSYAAVFDVLLALSGESGWAPETVSDADIRAEDDPAVLDRLWEEQPAFGSPAACGAAAPKSAVSVVKFHPRSRSGTDPKPEGRGLSPISALQHG